MPPSAQQSLVATELAPPKPHLPAWSSTWGHSISQAKAEASKMRVELTRWQSPNVRSRSRRVREAATTMQQVESIRAPSTHSSTHAARPQRPCAVARRLLLEQVEARAPQRSCTARRCDSTSPDRDSPYRGGTRCCTACRHVQRGNSHPARRMCGIQLNVASRCAEIHRDCDRPPVPDRLTRKLQAAELPRRESAQERVQNSFSWQ